MRALILSAICMTLAAQESVSYRDLLALVRSAIAQHMPDQSLAKSLSKLKLSQKLDSTTIDELQSEGAGAETVDALERLREVSAALPADTETPVYLFPPHPSVEQQKQFFGLLMRNALKYTASLPDFICTEVVRRYTAPVNPPAKTVWKPQDVLTVKLTYFDNHEKYELILLNGRKTSRSYDTSGGEVSHGDFGTLLLEIFSPISQTQFQWDHWTHLRKHLTQVYSYRTDRVHSHYKLLWGTGNNRLSTVSARHGYVYADDESCMVTRITGEADSIPPGFPITAQSNVLDYDMLDIGGRQFLVPLRVEQRMQSHRLQYKNVEEFENYHKFSGDSTISFDDPGPDAR